MRSKKLLLWLFVMFCWGNNPLWACNVCQSQQPEGFENITHGAGPTGFTDYLISWIAVIIVLIALGLSIKYLVKPNENRVNHIKNLVLNDC